MRPVTCRSASAASARHASCSRSPGRMRSSGASCSATACMRGSEAASSRSSTRAWQADGFAGWTREPRREGCCPSRRVHSEPTWMVKRDGVCSAAASSSSYPRPWLGRGWAVAGRSVRPGLPGITAPRRASPWLKACPEEAQEPTWSLALSRRTAVDHAGRRSPRGCSAASRESRSQRPPPRARPTLARREVLIATPRRAQARDLPSRARASSRRLPPARRRPSGRRRVPPKVAALGGRPSARTPRGRARLVGARVRCRV